MKKIVAIFAIGLFLLIGCSKPSEKIQVKISQPELPEVIITNRYGALIDRKGDLYTWGYDGRNAGAVNYAGNSLGQGTEVVYNNIPTKIYSDVAYIVLGNRGLTRNGEMIEWSKLMNNDPCVPRVVKESIAKIGISLYISQDGELYSVPESENIALKNSYELSERLILTGVKDFTYSYQNFALKYDGSVWIFSVSSMTTEIVEKPKKLMDGVKKIVSYPMLNAAALFLKDDGTLWACGGNEYGQCGNGEHGDLDTSTQDCVVKEPYKLAENVIDMWEASATTFYLTADHKLYACGENPNDVLMLGGNGHMNPDNHPEFTAIPVLVMEEVRQAEYIGAGFFVLKTDKTLWSWGYADGGIMGNGVCYEGENVGIQTFMERSKAGEMLISPPTKIMEDVERLFTETTDLYFAQKTGGTLWYWGFGLINVDEDSNWDTKVTIGKDEDENPVYAYQKHYIIPTPIEFSVETFFQNALDSIAAREGIDVTQYQAVRHKDQ